MCLDLVFDQGLYSLKEPHRMRQARVRDECRLVFPVRVNIEEAWILDRAKRMDAQAAGLFSGGRHHVLQRLFNLRLYSWLCVKSHEDEEFHVTRPNGW